MPTTNQALLFLLGSCWAFSLVITIAPGVGAFYAALIALGSTIASLLLMSYAFPED